MKNIIYTAKAQKCVYISCIYACDIYTLTGISMKITEKFLKSKNKDLEGKVHKDFPDGGGLLVRAYDTGSIAFYFRYRWKGKQAIMKIGSYPETTLKDARATHRELKEGMETGVDPRNRALSQRSMTLKEGYEYWFDSHILPNRKLPKRVQRSFEKHIVKKHGDLIIDEMTIAEWERVVSKPDYPVLSGYLLRECKGMISFLMRKQKINNDNIRHIIITDIGKQAAKRDRVYTKGELRKVLDYCLDQTFPIETRLPLLIIMITGCRMSEVATAMRSDFDFDERIWTVPRVNSKNKAKIVRPIPEFIIPMFKELFEAQGNEKPLLVTNRGGCISPPWLSIKLNSLRDLIGVEGMILHSFRHTLTTQYANLNIPPHIAEKQCGHKLSGVMAIYNRAEYLPEQLEAMEKYVAWIQE